MILGQPVAQVFKTFFRRIDHGEQLEILWGDRPRISHDLKIEHLVPVFAAINEHKYFLCQFLGLRQRKYFEEFIQSSEPSWKDDQCLRQVSEPELPHEKVMELEVQRRRDVGVRVLLKGKIDVEANGFASRFYRAQVRRFHDAWPSARGHNKAVPACGNLD